MNRALQAALIQRQVADINQDADCRIIPHANRFQLHLDMKGLGDRRYHLVMDLDDYDVEPPRLCVVDANGSPAWTTDVMPPHPVGNTGIHPIENRMFLCVRGTRDFHSHPLHAHEPWDQLRNNLPLSRLVADLRAMIQTVPTHMVNLQLQVPLDWKRIVVQVQTPGGVAGEFVLDRQ